MDLEYYKCKAELSSAIDDILNEVVVKEEPIEIKTFSEYGVLNEYLEKNDSKSSPTHFYKNEDFNGLVGELAKPKVNHCENDDEDLPMNIDLLTDNAGLIKQTFKTEFDIDIIYEDVKPQICEEKSSGENENEFYLNSVTDKSIGTNISLELSKDYETWSQQNIEEDGKAVERGNDTRKKSTTINSKNCQIIHNYPLESKLEFEKRPQTGEKSFQCKSCPKSFTAKHNLLGHERTHTGEKPFECKFCTKLFTQKWHLTVHERIHAGEKSLQCKICLRNFPVKSKLVYHERIHTWGKPFQCKYCTKSFAEENKLLIHETNHTGGKPFECKICSQSFNLRAHLTRHERIHTGEKPFQCKVCSKWFNTRWDLTRHERIHTGEKPFKCKFCPRRFVEKNKLLRHETIHT